MIDLDAGRRWLARCDQLDDAEIADRAAAHPVFQNIAYPVALPPLFVDGGALAGLDADAAAYVALLERVVGLYRDDAAVRDFFALDSAAAELIDAEGRPARAIRICRLDGYVDAAEGGLRILENNADCPAGTLFTPRLNRLIRDLLGPELPPPRLAMDDGDPFTETLLAGCRPGRLHAAVLQVRGRGNRESDEVAATLRELGHACAVVDPRELELSSDGLIAGGHRLDLVWNKINTASWIGLAAESPGVVRCLAETCRHPGRPQMLNSFGARAVAEAKTSLALLHAAELADRFTVAERALADRLLPWTQRLDRDREVELDGRRAALDVLARERRDDLVLKQRYDIRGDGVTIGRAVSPEAWDEVLASSWGTGAVLQRRVAPTRYPVRMVGRRGATDHNVSLDCFVFDGRLVGLGAKASVHDKVNLFQGGSKLAVVVGAAP